MIEKNTLKLVGSHYVLSKLPLWATAAIFSAILLIIFIGRDIFEGLAYNIAYSATVGDAGLTAIVLIGATILQRSATVVPRWISTRLVHIAALLVSIAAGITVSFFTLGLRSGQMMDIYHDVVVVPLFAYLAITVLPVIFKNGTKSEVVATVSFILLWIALVSFDFTHDRLNQRQWLQKHGVVFEAPYFLFSQK